MKLRLQIASVCRTLPAPGDAVAGSFVFNRIAAMARQADVRVLQPVPTFPLLRPLPAWAHAPAHTHQGVQIEHARMFYVPGLFKSLDSRWLARSIQRAVSQARSRGGLDLLDAHFGYPDGVGCVRVGQRLGVPVFVTLRGLEVDILQAPALRSQLLDALHAAAGCISVSHSLKDLMVSHGIAAAKIAVIPNAIDSDAFRPGDRDAARSRLGLSADRPLVVSVGNLLRVKRHDVLIRAVHELRARHPDVQLAIIGAATHEPETPQALRDLCRQLRIEQAVRFVGRVAPVEVVEWLRAADVFALASEREGCCNAVLEALATGVPVVTTPAGDNAQYVKSGQNGELAPIGDSAALAAALAQALANDTWKAAEISRALHSAVGNWTDVAARVLQFFRQRLASPADRFESMRQAEAQT